MERVLLKVKRQDGPEGLSYWEEFAVPYRPGMTVVAALMGIQDDPITADGLPTTPVVWEHNCGVEICGSCSMVINGKVRQACSTLIDDLNQPIVLEPMGTFPVVRDLSVDRGCMFESLARIRPWAEVDDLSDRGFGPARTPAEWSRLYPLSTCIACGCCLEACPQVNDRSPFVGAFLVAQVLLHNQRHPDGATVSARLDAMRAPGGIGECDNVQNCEAVCPKGIPLTDAVVRMQGRVFVHAVRRFFGG